ncbi:hypothetical protein MANES_15G166150v8 [Manihot esculenta]|uniref:Uncharacterized protein n=1 Tax=Manihot esculenta TaxID=3983 RepID=A0ACB7GDJ6_MANES|nr:hypothetical protein MANES_15G166150v8 [Manihot esculenta]
MVCFIDKVVKENFKTSLTGVSASRVKRRIVHVILKLEILGGGKVEVESSWGSLESYHSIGDEEVYEVESNTCRHFSDCTICRVSEKFYVENTGNFNPQFLNFKHIFN